MGQLPEAEKDYEQALSIQKQLADDFPSKPEFRRDLANSHNNRTILLSKMGRLPEAEKDSGQALSIQKHLAADFPSRPEFREDLARSHNNRGLLLSKMGRLAEAEKDYDQALSIKKQLADDFPNQPDRWNELAGTCVNLAHLHLKQGNSAAAKQLLLESQQHHRAALKANPRNPTYRQFYRNHLTALTVAHAGLLEQREALRAAETCRNLGWTAPDDAYAAARGLCGCILAVAKHDKLDEKQREAAAELYSDAAMKALREAVSKGYKDVSNMKTDDDLNPLRQREDFQKLVAELEGKGK
jgi:tetratricopeptide (TPR) repeat protein